MNQNKQNKQNKKNNNRKISGERQNKGIPTQQIMAKLCHVHRCNSITIKNYKDQNIPFKSVYHSLQVDGIENASAICNCVEFLNGSQLGPI